MTLLEKDKSLTKEAAQSDFLWELGTRVPSAKQARKVCQILGLNLADEKRVKAILRMREKNPETLQEILDAARVSKGEETMPDVQFGPRHYQIVNDEEDIKIWDSIAKKFDLAKKNDNDVRQQVMWPVKESSGYVVYIIDNRCGVTNLILSDGSRHINGRVAILIKPEVERLSFYDAYIEKWNNITVELTDRSFLPLAKKIACAYEAATARRKKPAKAIVVKNY